MTMSWIEEFKEPLWKTQEQAEQYVAAELARAVPPEWTVERIPTPAPAWRIVREVVPKDEWPIQEYGVSISAGLDLIVFTHGNKDVGPLSLHHVLLDALVLEAPALRRFGLAECIQRLFRECRPNEWGYT